MTKCPMTTRPMTDTALLLSFRNNLRACTSCELRTKATAPVPWRGSVGSDIAVVGEAPGRSEDKEGRPFIGDAGILLQYLLKEADLPYDDIAFLNACQCYPGDLHNPTLSHINACRPWMRGQIAFIAPRFVITVGVTALRSVRNLTWPKLERLHGKPLHWEGPPAPAGPITIWPTYHPASALPGRSPKYKKIILGDLRAFRKWVADGEAWPETCYICGEEVYRYDSWGIALCERHSQRQGLLWPEDVTTVGKDA